MLVSNPDPYVSVLKSNAYSTENLVDSLLGNQISKSYCACAKSLHIVSDERRRGAKELQAPGENEIHEQSRQIPV
jgi:hypothetical protein